MNATFWRSSYVSSWVSIVWGKGVIGKMESEQEKTSDWEMAVNIQKAGREDQMCLERLCRGHSRWHVGSTCPFTCSEHLKATWQRGIATTSHNKPSVWPAVSWEPHSTPTNAERKKRKRTVPLSDCSVMKGAEGRHASCLSLLVAATCLSNGETGELSASVLIHIAEHYSRAVAHKPKFNCVTGQHIF